MIGNIIVRHFGQML